MPKPPANAPFYDVPAGTRASQCRGPDCKATIYWIVRPNGKKMPIDCDVDGGSAPSEFVDPAQTDAFSSAAQRDGRGVSHFQTCANAGRF